MRSLQVFTALAEAEAKVHGKTVDEVHSQSEQSTRLLILRAAFYFGIFGDRKDFCSISIQAAAL